VRNNYSAPSLLYRIIKLFCFQIEDTKTPSRARLTLPANLEVQNLADNSTNVVARAPFVRSVQFGPFIARHTQMLHPAVIFPLKVLINEGNVFDVSGINKDSVMCDSSFLTVW